MFDPMLLRRVLALGLVGCVAACGIELSSVPGNEGTDKTASSSSSSSSGASSSSSSSGASSSSSSGDASTVVDAAPDVPKVPPPQYKWRCTPVTDGMAKFNPAVGGTVAAGALCTADHLAKCAGIGFRPDSDCGKLGDTTRTCVPLCTLNGDEASYTWDNVCTCGL